MCEVTTGPGRECADNHEGEKLVLTVETFAKHD